MTVRGFLILAGATLVAVVLAAVIGYEQGGDRAIAERGQQLVPGLVDRVDDIQTISVTRDTSETVLQRRNGAFVDQSGYPVSSQAVRELIGTMALLTIEEGKTSDPERYADLDLADPASHEGAGVRVALLDADADVITALIVGSRDFSVGGGAGGQFARLEAEPQSYLVRGRVRLPSGRGGWFDTELLRLPAAELKRLTLTPTNGEPVDLLPDDQGLYLAGPLPEGRVPDDTKVSRLQRFSESLDFEDVRAAEGEVPDDGAKLFAETEVLRVTLHRATPLDGDEIWVRIAAEALHEGGEEQAAAIAQRTDGFAFRLNSYAGEVMTWQVADVTADAPDS